MFDRAGSMGRRPRFNVQVLSFGAQCSMSMAQCSKFNVHCLRLKGRCSMFKVQCSTPAVQRSMSHVRGSKLNVQHHRSTIRGLMPVFRFPYCIPSCGPLIYRPCVFHVFSALPRMGAIVTSWRLLGGARSSLAPLPSPLSWGGWGMRGYFVTCAPPNLVIYGSVACRGFREGRCVYPRRARKHGVVTQ